VRPGARPEYCATGIPLTAAPAATSWDRVWSDTATFTAPVVAVVAVVEGAEVVSVVEGAGAVEVVEAADVVVVPVVELPAETCWPTERLTADT